MSEVSEVQTWNLLIYINWNPHQTLAIYVGFGDRVFFVGFPIMSTHGLQYSAMDSNLKPESSNWTDLRIEFSWQFKIGYWEKTYFTNDSIGLLDKLIGAAIES